MGVFGAERRHRPIIERERGRRWHADGAGPRHAAVYVPRAGRRAMGRGWAEQRYLQPRRDFLRLADRASAVPRPYTFRGAGAGDSQRISAAAESEQGSAETT